MVYECGMYGGYVGSGLMGVWIIIAIILLVGTTLLGVFFLKANSRNKKS